MRIRNYGQQTDSDIWQTPIYAVEPILKYLSSDWTLWEPAAGDGQIVRYLEQHKYSVVTGDIQTGQDFFEYQPGSWDCQITNPPYSLKMSWLERSYLLDKPFALLMPIDVLATSTAQQLFKRYGIGVLLLDKQVVFGKTDNGNDMRAAVAWYTWQLGIDTPFEYAEINRYVPSVNGALNSCYPYVGSDLQKRILMSLNNNGWVNWRRDRQDFGVHKVSLSRALRRLEQKGLVICKRYNSIAHQVKLSDAGIQMVNQTLKVG